MSLSSSGNHALVVVCSHKTTKKMVRFSNTHFDCDDGTNRGAESNALAKVLSNHADIDIDIIAGDFNDLTDSSVVYDNLVKPLGFIVIVDFTDDKQTFTHPYKSKPFPRIDHILLKSHGNIQIDTQSAKSIVVGSEAFKEFPFDEDSRVCKTFNSVGSDHFPVVMQVELTM